MVAECFLPKDIIYRKKIGFAAPVERWLKQGQYFLPAFKKNFNSWNIFSLSNEKYDSASSLMAVQHWVLNNFFEQFEGW